MTATTIVKQPVTPLPRDIDVTISISRPQTEITTDLSLLVFCTPDADRLPPDNGRVVLASNEYGITDALKWTGVNTGTYAAAAWANQSPRARRMAVGKICESPVQPQVMAAAITNFVELATVTDGAFAIDIVDDAATTATVTLTDLDFSGVNTLAGAVAVINTGITAAGAASVLQASIEYDNRLVLTALDGHRAIAFAVPAGTGTDVSTALNLTAAKGARKWDYYEPQGLVEEVKLIQKALAAMNTPAFVVAVDKKYRDTEELKALADYAESQSFRMAATLCTNSQTALDSADTSNIIFYAKNKGYRATSTVYSSHIQEYPEIAFVQDTLSTNYALKNSTGTAKFKNGVGITPENICETELAVLESRNCNTFVRVGNTARTFREGTQAADTWWTDSYYGVCNLREELQVAIFNLLLRRRKVPLDHIGVAQVKAAATVVFERYVYNGFLSSRQILDDSLNSPYITKPPYSINPTPIYLLTESERASRRAPPFHCTAYEAGAIHKADFFIDLVN